MAAPMRIAGRRSVIVFIVLLVIVVGAIVLIQLSSEKSAADNTDAIAESNRMVQWRDGARLSIFFVPDATQQQIDAVAAELAGVPEAKSFRYVDKAAAYEEAKILFADDPKVLADLSVAKMPTSFRVVPVTEEATDVIGDRFRPRPGISTVTYARDVTRTTGMGE